MVNFGEKLKSLRTVRGLTQQQLATRIGITKSVISAYESSMRSPSLDSLKKIAVTFGVTTDYLLGVKQTRTLDVSDLTEEEVSVVVKLVDLLRAAKTLPVSK